MSWTEAKEAIKAAVVSAIGISPKSVLWKRGAVPFGNSLVFLDVTTAQQELPDRVEPVFNVAADKFDVETSTLMLFTISAYCESVSGDTLELAELLRSGLAWPSVKGTLGLAGVAVVGFPGSVIPVDNVILDDRAANAHLLDIQFRAEFHRADPEQITTIEHVETETTLTDLDGSTLDDSETFDRV